MTFVNVPSTESADYINAQKNEWQDTYYVDNLNTLGAGGGGGGGDFTLITTQSGTGIVGSMLILDGVFSSDYDNYRFVADWWTDPSASPTGDKGLISWATGPTTTVASNWIGRYTLNYSFGLSGGDYINPGLCEVVLAGDSNAGYGAGNIKNRSVIDISFGVQPADRSTAKMHIYTYGYAPDYSSFVTFDAAAFSTSGAQTVTGIALGGEYYDFLLTVSAYGINTTVPS